MVPLSVTQEYLLLALEKSKGKIAFHDEEEIFIAAGGIIELVSGGYIVRADKGKLVQGKALEKDLPYLRPLCSNITTQQKSKDVGETIEGLVSSLLKELKHLLCHSLVEAGCAKEITKEGLFGKKKRYQVNLSAVDATIAKLRGEFLKDGPLSTSAASLVLMMEESNLLGRYFSKYETKRFKKRLKEARASEVNELLEEALEEYA
ncbi:MAG: GPP34 family phosphoprotein [Clostridiales bacterium]|jgi:hypothetical protein|nr:GPP34 family phosphoprotein [Clostridiales bacterium]